MLAVPFPKKLDKLPDALTSEDVTYHGPQTPSALQNTFYCNAYADPHEGEPNDYDLKYYPPQGVPCRFNFGFININDLKAKGTYGNTTLDDYNVHVRDKAAVIQLRMLMQSFGRTIQVSFIDDPDCHWSAVQGEALTNFIRNSSGEATADGHVLSGNMQVNYEPDGRMMDAETDDDSIEPFSDNCQAAFLRGIQLDPQNYKFVYCSYADRDIDRILNEKFTGKNATQKELMRLGFTCIADFITKRPPGLSEIHTMSYAGDAQGLLEEGDSYALMLANGDKSKLYEMRKFIRIGVSPNITDPSVANQVASACDPAKEQGFGGFMVWAGNSPAGLAMFNSMTKAQTAEVHSGLAEAFSREKDIRSDKPWPKLSENAARQEIRLKYGGNRNHFLKAAEYKQAFSKEAAGFLPGTAHAFHTVRQERAQAKVGKGAPVAAKSASSGNWWRMW